MCRAVRHVLMDSALFGSIYMHVFVLRWIGRYINIDQGEYDLDMAVVGYLLHTLITAIILKGKLKL